MSENGTEKKIGYRDILRQKEYMKIIVANLINRFGDSIDAIAFTWLVYAVTGSAAWTAVIFALNQIPSVVLQPFAGAFVEGMRKKSVVVAADFLRGGIVAGLAALYLVDMVTPFVLAVFTLTISSVEAFCMPASTALVPKILDKEYYAFGTSLNSTASRITELIGMGLAGVLIAALGVGTAILIDCATFFIAGIITMFVKVEEKRQKEDINADVKAYFGTLKDGFGYVKNKQAVMNFCILAAFANATLVPLGSLQSAMTVEIFGVGSELLSVFGVAATAGMGIGTVVFPYLIQKFKPLLLVSVSGVFLGIVYVAMILLSGFTYGNLLLSAILCAVTVFGMGGSMSFVIGTLNVQFMKVVEEQYLARAASIFNAGASAVMPVMSFLISALLLKTSVSAIFLLCGGLCAAVFAGAGILRVRLEAEPEEVNSTVIEE